MKPQLKACFGERSQVREPLGSEPGLQANSVQSPPTEAAAVTDE
jgi:hypothetical protein